MENIEKNIIFASKYINMSEKEKYLIVVNALREKAAEILPKGSQVALYGSRARGDNRPDSDWDIHVLIPGDENFKTKTPYHKIL